MMSTSLVFSIISFITPLSSSIFHDIKRNLRQYSLKEVLQTYPIFITAYIVGRIWLSFAIHMTRVFSEVMASTSDNPDMLVIISQLILLGIDIMFWHLVNSSRFFKSSVKTGTIAIAILFEGIILQLLAMIIPVIADGTVVVIQSMIEIRGGV